MQERVAAGADGELLSESLEPGIVVLTLNRPKARNALSLSMLTSLRQAFDTIGRDTSVAAIVLAANGPVFCSGHDLKEMTARRGDADGGKAFFDLTMTTCAAMMQSIVKCPRPVIAAVEGPASAAGAQLIATCDMAVAAASATFTTPGVNIGLFCSTPMVAVSRAVGRKRALEMLLTGTPIDARTAVDWGLVNRAVPSDELDAVVDDLAGRIAAASAATVAIGKAAFWEQVDRDEAGAYAYTREVMARNAGRPAAQEGIGAFLGKRAPVWPE